MMGMAQPVVLSIPIERPVFVREYDNNEYGMASYFLSKILTEIPVYTVQSALAYLVTYWLVGLNGNFFEFVGLTAFFGFVAASLSMVLGAVAATVQVALQLLPLVFVPQLLFSGFFIPINKIPVVLRWAQYLCSLKYALNLMVLAEFDLEPRNWPSGYDLSNYEEVVYGCSGANLVDGECVASAQTGATYDSGLLPRSEISTSDTAFYVALLFGMAVAFRLLALVALLLRARRS